MAKEEINNAEPVIAEEREEIDLFAFDQPIVEPEPGEEQPEVEEEVPADEPSAPAKLTPEQAYQKLQSEKDRIAAEAQKLQNQMAEYQEYAPIIRYMQENPKVIESLEQSLVKKPDVPAQETLQRPEKPQKPKDYSRYDANNDPDSESAKYADALEAYKEQYIEYTEKIQEQKVKALEEKIQKDQAVRQQQALLMDINNKLITQYKFTDELAKEFIQEMSNPNPTLDELVELFKVKKRITTMSKEELAKRAAAAKKPTSPIPAGAGRGFTPPPADDSVGFQASLGKAHIDEDALFAVRK